MTRGTFLQISQEVASATKALAHPNLQPLRTRFVSLLEWFNTLSSISVVESISAIVVVIVTIVT